MSSKNRGNMFDVNRLFYDFFSNKEDTKFLEKVNENIKYPKSNTEVII